MRPLRFLYLLEACVSSRYSGIVRAQGCEGLHPCAESGSEGRAEPDGRDLGGVLY